MRALRVVLFTSLVVLVASAASAYVAEGTAKGPVIVVGEDRIAVQTQETRPWPTKTPACA